MNIRQQMTAAPERGVHAASSFGTLGFLGLVVAAILLSSWIAHAAGGEPAVRLTGIAQLDTRTVALLEVQDSRGITSRSILSAGERVESFELVAINPRAAEATVKLGDKTIDIALGSPVTTDQAPRLQFKAADARQGIELYQMLGGRTVLLSPSLPTTKITLTSGPGSSTAACLSALETALREQGIFITSRAGKFAFATSISQVPRLSQIPDPPAAAENTRDEKFPPGSLKFVDADVRPTFDIYQELTGRTLLASPELPAAKISFKTQTPLSRAEAIWLLEAQLYLANIRLIPEGTKFTFALPATRNGAAPKIPDNPAAEKLKSSQESLAAGALKFNGATPQQVLAFYAALLGRQPLNDARTTPTRFTLRNQTALLPVEAIHALDALAALHHLRFERVGDQQVTLVHAPEAPKPSSTTQR